ncbi:MAG: hypothetical protein L3J69_18965, partial [Desulfobacula sp.]|nr:hypothetical protein [Desulfobacula sp.]
NSSHGNTDGNMDNGIGNHGMNQSAKKRDYLEILNDFFKNMENFQVDDKEETDLINNSWDD